MKAWLIVSELTFVPNNYDQFLQDLVDDPRIVGCTILRNNNWSFKLKALLLLATGFASRLGLQLLKNSKASNLDTKIRLFTERGKIVHVTKNPHDDESIRLLQNTQVEIIINARTRCFFKKHLLNLPSKGCLNIHHGLLPDQRGLMCDFWGLYHGEDSGFSIHQMTSKLDAGNIFWTQIVSPHPHGYLAQTGESAKQEALAIKEVMTLIETENFTGWENRRSPQTRYYKNPGLKAFLAFYYKGRRL